MVQNNHRWTQIDTDKTAPEPASLMVSLMKTEQTTDQSRLPGVSRRKFLAASGAAAAAAFTIVPRHGLGGAALVAPTEKITVAHIGCGTQGLRELPGLLALPEVQIVAACDPVKESYDYVDWSR